MNKISVKAKLIKIGNSRGVRLPKELIEQAGLKENVDLIVHDGEILIANRQNPRAGWEESFAVMAQRGDDKPVLPDILPGEILEDWEWK
jgi:antitoxin MazE